MEFHFNDTGINLEDIGFDKDYFPYQLKNLSIYSNNEKQFLYKWLPRLYNLERLALEHCLPHLLESLCFQYLRSLNIHYNLLF